MHRISNYLKKVKPLFIPVLYLIVILLWNNGISAQYYLLKTKYYPAFLYAPVFIFILPMIISLFFTNSTLFYSSLLSIFIYDFYFTNYLFCYSKEFLSAYEISFVLIYFFSSAILAVMSERGIADRKKVFFFICCLCGIFYVRHLGPDFDAALVLHKIKVFSYPKLSSYFTVQEIYIGFISLFFICYAYLKRKDKIKLIYCLSSLLLVLFIFKGNGSKIDVRFFFPKAYLGFIFLGFLYFMFSLVSGYEKAYLDELTKVYGRRALNEEMNMLKNDYSLTMIDIDHFKKFNDTYGHEAGDIVLHSVAQSIQALSSGKVFRYGGEEFTIVFRHNKIKKIHGELEKIRKYIMKKKVTISAAKKSGKEKKVSVTISIGCSAFQPERHLTPKDVIKNADELLYKAKENGRNRVEIQEIETRENVEGKANVRPLRN